MKKLKVKQDEKDLLMKILKEKLKDITSYSELESLSMSSFLIEDHKDIKKPEILIPADVYYKMHALVAHSDIELSWHGLVKRDIEKQKYLIYDILMFPQINTAASTETDQDEYAEWLLKLIQKPDDSFENLRLHGHSHVNMNVYSSGIDDNYQKELLSNIRDDDFYIFMILNKQGEICTLLYDYHQQMLFTNEDIKISILSGKTRLDTWAKKQVKKYQTEKRPRGNKMGRYSYSIPKTIEEREEWI